MKHFKLSEFKCPCCGRADMQQEFLDKIDKARDIAGIPFVITSGFRCPKHNKEVGGRPNSAHTKGLAADIKCINSRDRFRMVKALLEAGFTRIGVGKDFIHADIDKSKPQEVIWTYYGNH